MELLKVSINSAGYQKTHKVIENINFTLHAGELIGLLGPNGVGKSTTIKSIMGTIDQIEGSIEFKGPTESYAYIPEQPIFYEDLTLWEHIRFLASLDGINESDCFSEAQELLKIFNLEEAKDQLPGNFSKGMQQKLMIVLAFLIKPDVYIIDEPFIGLDPLALRAFLRLLEDKRKLGAGVLMSTHVLDTAEKICDKFLLISNGSLVARGTLTEIKESNALNAESLYECFEKLLVREQNA
ncbi:ABC transporter ATP-binding protein [Halobacillus sp. H74]|uniref:ABC transporter ATP-binding protein n=1 Tax=Halobacillus sp. H74 TaxID=3457436 RepID=UPI003FCEA094